MPLFTYKAKTPEGKILNETLQATNKEEAVALIKQQENEILALKQVDSKLATLFEGKIPVSEKASFTRFLSTMLRSGLPLPEAIDIIREEAANKRLQKVLVDIAFQTRKGASMSSVLAKYPDDFDPVFITMVKAGEDSGSMDKSFDYLSKQLLASYELSQKVKGAMIYPSVIIAAMLGNAVIMVAFVLPRISTVFLNLNVKLPPVTKLMLQFGQFVGSHTAVTMIGILVLGLLAGLAVYLKKTRLALLALLAKLPAIRKTLNEIDVSRFARTLSTLLASGVAIIQALEVSAKVISQPKLKAQAENFAEGVSKGQSLSDIMSADKVGFPHIVVQTVRAGERSGTLDTVLLEMAEFYENEVDYSLKKVTSLIEPILMLVIGVAVGVMVLLMITPIYSIIGGIDGL